jgi:hypothetical protein
MKNFNDFPPTAAREIKYVLFDIDDTITSGGRLPNGSYNALWLMNKRGYKLIPVTGRPAGWCDLIIRQWPVDAIIGENGAFCYYRTDNGYAELTHPNICENVQERFAVILDDCLKNVPGCRVAKDQFARKYDLAVDFAEDDPKLNLNAAAAIRKICESYGAVAKVSSIHVNAWFGLYDKLSMAELMFERIFNEPDCKRASLFFGDSPNDEPMFGFFPHSCAVANILPFLHTINKKPAYVCEKESGEGFADSVIFFLSL